MLAGIRSSSSVCTDSRRSLLLRRRSVNVSSGLESGLTRLYPIPSAHGTGTAKAGCQGEDGGKTPDHLPTQPTCTITAILDVGIKTFGSGNHVNATRPYSCIRLPLVLPTICIFHTTNQPKPWSTKTLPGLPTPALVPLPVVFDTTDIDRV